MSCTLFDMTYGSCIQCVLMYWWSL